MINLMGKPASGALQGGFELMKGMSPARIMQQAILR